VPPDRTKSFPTSDRLSPKTYVASIVPALADGKNRASARAISAKSRALEITMPRMLSHSSAGQGTDSESINSAKTTTGYYVDTNGVNHGFLRTVDGTFDVQGAGTGSGQGTLGQGNNAADDIDPDFRFECTGANLLILSDAFIHAGSEARNQARRIHTRGVKSKTGRFSYVSTDF